MGCPMAERRPMIPGLHYPPHPPPTHYPRLKRLRLDEFSPQETMGLHGHSPTVSDLILFQAFTRPTTSPFSTYSVQQRAPAMINEYHLDVFEWPGA
jgi:hypothetical protein